MSQADVDHSREDRGERSRTVVLLVDDYTDARDLYAVFLTGLGYGVVAASNGEEACALATSDVSIVLMDLAMPVMDGYAATAHIKSRRAELPILVLTGQGDADAHARAWAAGCDALLVKPCLPDVVASEVRRLLRLAA